MLRVLIIGYGSIAKKHIRAINQVSKQVEIRLLRHQKQSTNNENNLHQFYDINTALRWSPSHIIICTPTSFHLNDIKTLIATKAKILIEKPIANPTLENIKILESMIPNEKLIKVAYPYRFHPMFETINDFKTKNNSCFWIIDRGYTLPKWQKNDWDYPNSYAAQDQMGGGSLLTLCHELDLFLRIYDYPSFVTGYCWNANILNINADEVSNYSLKWKNNNSASFRIDMLRPDNYLRITGISANQKFIEVTLGSSNSFKDDSSNKRFCYDFSDFSECYRKQMHDFLNLSGEKLCDLKESIMSAKVLKLIIDSTRLINQQYN